MEANTTTDELVIQFLGSAGVELPAKVASLGDLDSEALFAVCGHCLNAIAADHGKEERLPSKLPTNPGARFRACTSLATAISGLGFDGEIGFNHFLYPSEAETRKLLLFLIDQMPKTDGADADGDAGGLGGTMSFADQTRQALLRGLEVPWTPPSFADPARRRVLRPELSYYLRCAFARAALGAARKAEPQAAIEARLTGGARRGEASSGGFGDAPSGTAGTVAEGAAAGPAGSLFAHSAYFAYEGSVADTMASNAPTDGAPAETPAERAERTEREKLAQVQAELEKVSDAISKQQRVLEEANTAEAVLASAVRQLEVEAQRGEADTERLIATHATRRKALELATDPEGSRVRLQKASAQNAAALMQLAEEWEAHRAPLLEQIRAAQAARRERHEGAVAKMEAVKQMRIEMKGMVGELQERDETTARLTKELGRAKGAARSTYTDRIMDVVRNLRKQKAGIEAILKDIRESQKEVRLRPGRTALGLRRPVMSRRRPFPWRAQLPLPLTARWPSPR